MYYLYYACINFLYIVKAKVKGQIKEARVGPECTIHIYPLTTILNLLSRVAIAHLLKIIEVRPEKRKHLEFSS